MRDADSHRYKAEYNRDKVLVETAELTNLLEPKWDKLENSHFAMGRRLNLIFLKVGNKIMARNRAQRRLVKIKTWIAKKGIKTRAEMKSAVYKDGKAAMLAIDATDDSGDNIMTMRFTANF